MISKLKPSRKFMLCPFLFILCCAFLIYTTISAQTSTNCPSFCHDNGYGGGPNEVRYCGGCDGPEPFRQITVELNGQSFTLDTETAYLPHSTNPTTEIGNFFGEQISGGGNSANYEGGIWNYYNFFTYTKGIGDKAYSVYYKFNNSIEDTPNINNPPNPTSLLEDITNANVEFKFHVTQEIINNDTSVENMEFEVETKEGNYAGIFTEVNLLEGWVGGDAHRVGESHTVYFLKLCVNSGQLFIRRPGFDTFESSNTAGACSE